MKKMMTIKNRKLERNKLIMIDKSKKKLEQEKEKI